LHDLLKRKTEGCIRGLCEVFVYKDAYTFRDCSAVDNAGDALEGVIAKDMRYRKVCRRFPVKIGAGHGRSFTSNLETTLDMTLVGHP